MATWTDNHCHLPASGASDVVEDAAANGVVRLVDVGCDLASSKAAIARARELEGVWATVGVHPHEAQHGLDGIEELLGDPTVVAVGECGLDHHYMHSPAEAQREVFAAQIEMAHRHDLPLVIHTREAWEETFDVLADLGAVLSFSGIVSFPSAPEVRDAARLCPSDRYLVETDSPYLAPAPHRGKKNRPALVVRVGEVLAEVRGEPIEEVARQTSATAEAIYRFGDR